MTVSIQEAIEQLLAVLDEGFDQTSTAWTYFTDHAPETRLMGSLTGLSAAEASRTIGRNSIAAHAWHVVFGMRASTDWIRGVRREEWGWEESWKVNSVTDAEWSAILDDLRQAHAGLRAAISEQGAENAMAFGGAVGAVAHLAYHLGAIRQKIACRPS